MAATSRINESSIESSKAAGLPLGSPGPEELSLRDVLSDGRTESRASNSSRVGCAKVSSKVALVEGM